MKINEIYFTDEGHESAFLALLNCFNKQNDSEYAAAYYILTSSNELRIKCLDYVSNIGIGFPTMLKQEDFSHGYRIMVDCANNLFNHKVDIDLTDICCSLDDTNFKVIIQALSIRRNF